ncbi:MAG: ParA family protein [Bacteroidota bacterium]
MKIISLFNNKGGVGKSTLGYHLGYALSELNHKTLLIDLDPQCNLTICGIETEVLHNIWSEEDSYIDDFEKALKENQSVLEKPRSIHFLLKPTEDGLSDFEVLPPTVNLNANLDLIPGRLSIHKFENKLAERWNGAYQGDNLAIRTITKIREICNLYAAKNSYEYIIIDTSPSLGILNKTIISTVDGFFIPAQPDMFSLYGIRNIGNSLEQWKNEFDTIYKLISSDKRSKFPQKFVQFLGFTIYNAKKYTGYNKYDLAKAHYSYVKQIPDVIKEFIKKPNRELLNDEELKTPIGEASVIHSHNTFPSVSQALNCPIWLVPDVYSDLYKNNRTLLEEKEIEVNTGSYNLYRDTKVKYKQFAQSLLSRVNKL